MLCRELYLLPVHWVCLVVFREFQLDGDRGLRGRRMEKTDDTFQGHLLRPHLSSLQLAPLVASGSGVVS